MGFGAKETALVPSCGPVRRMAPARECEGNAAALG